MFLVIDSEQNQNYPYNHGAYIVVLELFGGSEVKASAYNVGDLGLIPGSGRSPGEGSGNLLQYSCLENPMDGGTWSATVHGVPKSRTRLSGFTSHRFSMVVLLFVSRYFLISLLNLFFFFLSSMLFSLHVIFFFFLFPVVDFSFHAIVIGENA